MYLRNFIVPRVKETSKVAFHLQETLALVTANETQDFVLCINYASHTDLASEMASQLHI